MRNFIPSRWTTAFTFWALLLIILSFIGLVLAALKTAATPYIVKGLMTAGGGALFLITLLAEMLNSPSLHDMMWHAYAIIFLAYTLHWIETLICQLHNWVKTTRAQVVEKLIKLY